MAKYFSKENDPRLYFCSETGEEGIDTEFVISLDLLREACGFPFVITSGYRSAMHSREIIKDEPGRHTEGIAADIHVINSRRRHLLVKNAMEMGFTGIGVAKDFIHVDTRIDIPRLWSYKNA